MSRSTAKVTSVDPLMQPDRFPRSSRYDPDWVRRLDMGPHPLWQLEHLVQDLDLHPGQRVLDLGCGKGATSVFLAREFGVNVTAVDLWISETELRETVEAAGVGSQVTTVQADARRLPFDADVFDVIVSVDAFEYFGTDARFLPGLLHHLRPGGRIGVSTPALRLDPYDAPPPQVVTDVVGWEAAAWHNPQWWHRHWELTGQLRDINAQMQDGSRDDWLRWIHAFDQPPETSLLAMLNETQPDEIGFTHITATKV